MGGRKRSRCSSVPWANRAGAARLSPERVQPPQVEAGRNSWSTRRATSPGRSSPPYATGHVGTTSPDAPNTGYHASYSGAAPHLAHLGRPAPATRRHPARRHDARVPRPGPRASDSSTGVSGPTARRARAWRDPRARAHRPEKFGGRFSTKAASPPGSPRCATTAPWPAPRSAAARAAGAVEPACSSHLVSPSVTVGAPASRSTNDRRLVVERVAGHGSVHHAPGGGIGARDRLARAGASRAARTSPMRRGSSQVPPVSGVKPRSA